MGDDSISRNEHNEYLFHHLVAMFQTLALQQLGKLVNPITGQMERDLQQAKITIDMLQMLKDRTAGNLEQSERMVLDRALLELQMNYVDETNKPEEAQSSEGDESSAREEPGDGEAGADKAASEKEEESETVVKGDTEIDSDASAPGKDGKKTKSAKRKSSKKKKSG